MKTKDCKILLLLVVIVSLSVLTGCGGGGSGTSSSSSTSAPDVSGVAAGGAPLIGSVWIKDKSGSEKGPYTINADGSFTVPGADVSKLTAPFFLKAEGTIGDEGFTYYSAATGAGTANINPLAHLVVASATGVSDPGTAYGNPSSYASSVTAAALTQAVQDVQTMIQPLLSNANANNVNPITDKYTANHAGLDGIIDSIKVSIDSSKNIQVVNNASGKTVASASIVSGRLGSMSAVKFSDATDLNSATADMQGMASMLSDFGAKVVNVKGKNITAADIDPYFLSTFTHDGRSKTDAENMMVAKFKDIANNNVAITQIKHLRIKSYNASTQTYLVGFNMQLSDGAFENDTFAFKKDTDGKWKFAGNGYYSSVQVNPKAVTYIKADGTTQIESGMHFYVGDFQGNQVTSATITGPGLPAAGITLSKPGANPTDLRLDLAFRTNTLPIKDWNFYVMSDTVISSITAPATYTVTVTLASGKTETRNVPIAKKPVTRTAAVSKYFPTLTFTNHTLASLTLDGVTPISFTYAKQATTDYRVLFMRAQFTWWDINSKSGGRENLPLSISGTSGKIVPAKPSAGVTAANLAVVAGDQAGRRFITTWLYQ